jgi:sugar phosphate isomerase/epimerase
MHSISRRTFLARGSAAAVAATSLAQRGWATPAGKPLGIQLYMVGTELSADLKGTLTKIRAIGYEHVESYSLAHLTATEFRKALDDAGLKCHSSHLNLNLDDLGPAFANANALGASYAVSSILQPDNKTVVMTEAVSKLSKLTLDDFKKMAAEANHVGQKAKEAGLQYAYHNHNFEFKDQGNGQIGYDLLLQETDPELVKFELDCGWMSVGGRSPIEYFKKYPDRYRLFHAKDFVSLETSNSTDSGKRPAITEVGSGKIDWRSIIAAAKAAGVEFYYVDHDPPFKGKTAFDAAKIDYDYLQPLLG